MKTKFFVSVILTGQLVFSDLTYSSNDLDLDSIRVLDESISSIISGLPSQVNISCLKNE